jgi:hypothetical protein
VNEIGKVNPKRGREPSRRRSVPDDMSWVDRLEPLDADAEAAALERPGPETVNGRDWVARFAGTLDEDFARGALDQEGPDDGMRSEINPG